MAHGYGLGSCNDVWPKVDTSLLPTIWNYYYRHEMGNDQAKACILIGGYINWVMSTTRNWVDYMNKKYKKGH